jgi:hypothetical protein
MFSESLVVTITADSSGVSRELDSLASRLAQLERSFGQVQAASGRVGSGLSSLANSLGPLGRVQSQLSAIAGQVAGLSRTPISLNVAPAMAALNSLSAAIARVASQLASLGAAGGGGSRLPLPATNAGRGTGGSGSSRVPGMPAFAAGGLVGGLVTGPVGTDRVPAWLSAGEFVVREPAVKQVGTGQLEALNRSGRLPQAEPRSETTVQQTSVGEFHVHMAQSGNATQILHELEWESRRLRERRG